LLFVISVNSDDEDEDIDDEEVNLIMTPWKSSIFDTFENWLCSPDGKCKPRRQSIQHSRQSLVILKECSDHTFNFESIFNRKSLRDKWLCKIEIEKKPGTVKSYLHSLRFFYQYVLCEKPEALSSYVKKCEELIIVIGNWLAVYRDKQKSHTWKNELRNLEQLLTSSDLNTLDNSAHVSYCRHTVTDSTIETPTMKQFVSVRNYLMMYLCIDNASRTGAIANMTVKEFSKASRENNVYRVHVFDHKTVATSGPAVLVFTSSLYNEANLFLSRFRNKLLGLENAASFFISWNGKKLASFMVTTQLNSFWGKAVGHTEDRPRFNATMVRKYAVTKVHNQKPEMKKNLALLMCHSDQTAVKSYYLQEKTKNACKTSTNLRDLLRTDEPSDDLPKSQAEIDENIFQVFKGEIEKGKITMSIVREKKTEELTSMTDLDLRDRILHLIRNQKEGK